MWKATMRVLARLRKRMSSCVEARDWLIFLSTHTLADTGASIEIEISSECFTLHFRNVISLFLSYNIFACFIYMHTCKLVV